MKPCCLLVCALFSGVFMACVSALGYEPTSPLRQVDTVRYEWHDDARNREVPVKIYYPANGNGPFPIIIFSHGLGGTREGYEYLGRYWAGHGYVSVHLQHVGSDLATLRKATEYKDATYKEAGMTSAVNVRNRALDVTFAINQLEIMNQTDTPLTNRLDLKHIGVAGHSFGAQTAMLVAGERPPELTQNMVDSRIMAAIAMSPPIPSRRADLSDVFGSIQVPVFVLTGTEDNFQTPADQRRLAYDNIPAPESCLVIFNGLDHMTFTDHSVPAEPDKDDQFHPLIQEATTAFWDAHLRGNTGAKTWLEQGGFATHLGDAGSFETK